MRQPRPTRFAAAALLLATSTAHANICPEVVGAVPTQAALNEEALYESLFLNDHGDATYNTMIATCNRRRDSLGSQIATSTQSTVPDPGKDLLATADLPQKPIEGHYNFLGLPLIALRYFYVLSRSDSTWTAVIPYEATIKQEVPGVVDLFIGNRYIRNGVLDASPPVKGPAFDLYDASQYDPVKKALIIGAKPITTTLCSTFTYQPGAQNAYLGQVDLTAYKRDRTNAAISRGLIQWADDATSPVQEGCRVSDALTLYYKDPADGSVTAVAPKDFVFDHFIRVAQDYWTIPGLFELKVLVKGHNEKDIDPKVISLVKPGDYLPIQFATRFVAREMYKQVLPVRWDNFSTMTSDTVLHHEVGHALGLDDEYGEDEGLQNCGDVAYNAYATGDYVMCSSSTTDTRSLYHYIAASRYLSQQDACISDLDCLVSEYCDKGVATFGFNQCLPKKADNSTCDVIGGAAQCLSGLCSFGHCYTPNSVNNGGTCYLNAACRSGQCSSLQGTIGTCVCNDDLDCGLANYCNTGLDIAKNACISKKADNSTCDVAGGGHQCLSGFCSYSRCYTPNAVSIGGLCYVNAACKTGQCSSAQGFAGTCVCNDDGDCAAGKYCNAGADFSKNACLTKKADNSTCDLVGGAHQCLSGFCSFSHCYTPNSVATGGTCFVNAACKSGKCSSVQGFAGTCVCDDDSDCAANQWCDAGLDLTQNKCKAKLPLGASCGSAGSVGNDHKCLSGNCSGFPKYECK